MKKLSIICFNLILITYSNICLSQDYWELVNSPDSIAIFDMDVDSEGRIYLACPFSSGNLTGIFRSDDNCETWQRMVEGMDTTFSPHTRSITIDNNDNIITGCNGQIYSSNDHGENWIEVYDSLASVFRVAEFGYDSIFLIGGGYANGIVRSGDKGLTWQPVLDFELFEPIYEEATTGICFGPNGIIYACSRTFVGGYGSVYKSEDLGMTWSVFFNDGYSQFFSIAFDQEGRLLVGGVGLHRYDFRNGFWEFFSYNMVPFEILVVLDSNIYLACDEASGGVGGVVFSDDIGETYAILNSGMDYPDANDFAIDAIGRILVSGFSDRLYRSYDTLITGFRNFEAENKNIPFSCYPNPFKNSTSIISNIDKPTSLIIYSSVGNIIARTTLEAYGIYLLQETTLPSGLFIAVLISGHSKFVIKILHF